MKLREFSIGQKKVFFLLVLTVSFILLLSSTKGYNFNSWYKTVEVYFTPETTVPSTISTTQSTPVVVPEVQRCNYKYLSPGNTEEGRRLLDSITWPETLPLPKPFSLNLTTCASKSKFSIVPRSGGWRVGDELEVRIQMRDYYGNQKRSGGDFLIASLHNRQLGAGVVGQVQDHLNGTFTARFPLLWNGTANVQVTLVHTSEAITILKRLTEEQPNRVTFSSDFKSGSVKETTSCNICLDSNKASLCNFTDLNTGEQWFCYKPKTLDCDTRINHFRGGYSWKISKEEVALFKNGINVKVPLMALGNKDVVILSKTGESNVASLRPSGFYFDNQWRPLSGPAVRQFNNASVITACLKGKQLHVFGDSTTRQYYNYLIHVLPNLQTFDKHSSPQCGPFMAIDYTNDIMVTFRCHGLPIRSSYVPASQLQYVANELDEVTGGPNTVVLVGVWAHYATYPMEVYYQRLVTIRKAVQRLLVRAPGTKVIIRTGNLKNMALFDCMVNNDWHSMQLNKVLRAVFKDTGVLWLEAWEMVQAHYFPHNLHPQPAIIKLMMDTVLSHTCAGMGS